MCVFKMNANAYIASYLTLHCARMMRYAPLTMVTLLNLIPRVINSMFYLFLYKLSVVNFFFLIRLYAARSRRCRCYPVFLFYVHLPEFFHLNATFVLKCNFFYSCYLWLIKKTQDGFQQNSKKKCILCYIFRYLYLFPFFQLSVNMQVDFKQHFLVQIQRINC